MKRAKFTPAERRAVDATMEASRLLADEMGRHASTRGNLANANARLAEVTAERDALRVLVHLLTKDPKPADRTMTATRELGAWRLAAT